MNRYVSRRLTGIIILIFVTGVLRANVPETDSIRLSLLTCAPGQEIYALFGHTGVRYEHPKKNIDLVFNYGMFNFNAPGFIWKFTRGETDYLLDVTKYSYFAAAYEYDNRAVWQQTLNLTSEEKKKLINLLIENARPENQVYRYNFFFDNCATRPRDKIEESVDGNIQYTNNNKEQTLRTIIHGYTQNDPWARFGIDFCMGAPADQPISDREKMFAPLFLMSEFASAIIIDGENNRKPLVADTRTIIEGGDVEAGFTFPLTPLQATLLLFIGIASATVYGLKKQKYLWGVDAVLFALCGVMGCLSAFLQFFSTHPTVQPNYLILVFHPLHILCLPFVLRKEIKRQKSLYHTLNFIVLTLFTVLWVIIPQRIDLALLPLTLCLLIRSANNLILSHRKDK